MPATAAALNSLQCQAIWQPKHNQCAVDGSVCEIRKAKHVQTNRTTTNVASYSVMYGPRVSEGTMCNITMVGSASSDLCCLCLPVRIKQQPSHVLVALGHNDVIEMPLGSCSSKGSSLQVCTSQVLDQPLPNQGIDALVGKGARTSVSQNLDFTHCRPRKTCVHLLCLYRKFDL